MADIELDQLLTDRGWVEFDRMDELTVYDWPPSAPDEEHEFTHLIIDLRGGPGAGPPYRVSVVNGDRLMYEAESALVADLNTIEASRACHSICVSPGWSIIGPPLGRTEGAFCDQDHAGAG